MAFAPMGTALANQVTGDCQTAVCDGNGGVTSEPAAADVLDDGKACTDDLCTGTTPSNVPSAPGMACNTGGGKLCDGQGACVECLSGSDCAGGVCQGNACVAASCGDGAKNGSETAIDCGGSCGPCDDLLGCAMAADCKSGVCTGGICQAPACNDAEKNGGETDVDCGGGCAPCGPGKGCAIDADCVGGKCSGSVCLPSCTDHVTNGGETDVDCGGGTCAACANGKACGAGADCASKVCKNGVCQAAVCTDGVKNAGETDVDCGGSCGPCAAGQACNGPTDCASLVCVGGMCQAPACNDGVRNGLETDVDCGGAMCGACPGGKGCMAGGDCASHLCVAGACTTPACGDGVVLPPEQCDDGNTTNGDGCSSTCAVQPGFTCSGSPSVCTTTCGDGFAAGTEGCDDGNAQNGDGCSSTCNVEIGFSCSGSPSTCAPICGDGIKVAAEACDDGNVANGDGCSSTCTVQPGFMCSGSPSVCTTTCGDGIKAGGEGCDDGNATSGDGCSSACAVEPGYTCTGTPSTCSVTCGDGVVGGTEICDDGNLVNGDGCSSTCKLEGGTNEVEPNDTFAQADARALDPVPTRIGSGTTLLYGSIGVSGDKDIFKVTTGGVMRFETFDSATFDCTSIFTKLSLFSSTGTLLKVDMPDVAASGINGCAALIVDAPTGSYIQVDRGGPGTVKKYILQAVHLASAGSESEPNDSLSQANTLSGTDVYITGQHPGFGQDWYHVTVPYLKSIRAEIIEADVPACESNNYFPQLTLFDGVGVQKVNDYSDGRGNCSAIDGTGSTPRDAGAHALPYTDYYLRVTGDNIVFNYRLAVTIR
jgi:cysteine-rich repeat protein